MAQPFVGEIRMFAGSFAPQGWAFCQGQTLQIAENETLFNLIGTTYGGDGQETFNLPNLGGRVPIHQGTGQDGISYQMAELLGVENVTLTTPQIPIHSHALVGSGAPATGTNPNGLTFGTGAVTAYMIAADAEVQLNTNAITPVGGSQPHDNLQPFSASTTSSRCSGSSRRRPRSATMSDPFVAEIRIFGSISRPRVGAVQRPTVANLAEHRVVLAARHLLRRRRRSRPSPCPTSKAPSRSAPVRAPALPSTSSAKAPDPKPSPCSRARCRSIRTRSTPS